MNNKAGIYTIRNTKNGRIYVGQTSDFDQRLVQHFTTLRNGSHHNSLLQDEFNDYGEKAFEFKEVEHVQEKNERLSREAYWIGYYDGLCDVYNIASTGKFSTKPTNKRILEPCELVTKFLDELRQRIEQDKQSIVAWSVNAGLGATTIQNLLTSHRSLGEKTVRAICSLRDEKLMSFMFSYLAGYEVEVRLKNPKEEAEDE